MEKTIVKVEKQQHKGSKSATTELIVIDDPAGHLVCSSCHDELPEKIKCASCFIKTAYTCYFIPTGYSRCHGVKRILQSIRVACPNAITGGIGKMLHHEKEELEKMCPIKAVHAQRQGRVAKMGPCGGDHGWKWGGAGGKRSEIHLQPEEYLTCVKGHLGHYNGSL